ncbi:hypothetical protein [Rhodococcus sp. X156]|uniref:hypothetical protein n=1 Tax=Rhodococcus sp. X156 TaxID=2499145 RepID=UPI0019D03938|nr:hypothetical protein [Rhodococcus sp. X156]
MGATVIKRGLLAGGAGVAALNAVTYLDMAVRGRPASSTPERTVDTLTDKAGLVIPGDAPTRDNRRTALGALSGIATGVAVGVAASVARAAGFAPPAPLGAVATGAAAMAVSDLGMAALRVSDPRTWSGRDWASDVVPHLAYGLAVRSVIHAQPTPAERVGTAPTRASAGLLTRSALLGVAAGGRSSLGLAGPALSSRRTGGLARGGAVLGVAGEMVMDKLPTTPSRLAPPALAGRVASGGAGAVALSRREHAQPLVPATVGALGAFAGSHAGAAWRSWAAGRMPDWQAALVEDVASVALAAVACLPGRPAAGIQPPPGPRYPELAGRR